MTAARLTDASAPAEYRMVGRVAELEVVVAAMRAGRPAVVEGEAGAGKTRLLSELRAVAVADGFQVAIGAADELNVDRPFGAVVDALGLDVLAPTSVGAGADLGYLIVEQAVGLVEQRCAEGPLLLAFDDVHWADGMTLRVIRALARTVGQLPLSLFVGLRSYPRRPEVDRVVRDLAAVGGVSVTLGPLSTAEVCELAAGLAGGAEVAPRLADHLARTGGNPLFVVELIGALQDDDPDPGVPPVLPGTVHAAIARRVGHVPPATQEVLKVASVLGADFSVAELAAVMGSTAVQLLATLEAALGAGVLGDNGDGSLVFRHDLIRDAVYGAIPVPIRKGLHRQAAHVLGGLGAPDQRVAEHLFAGASPGDAEAIHWLARAGRQAAPRAPAAAVVLLERALGLADPVSHEADSLASDLVPLLIQTGRAAEAQRLSRQVLERGPAPDVEAALRRAVGEVLWTRGWLEAALAELDQVKGDVGAAALAAFIRVFLGQPAVAAEQASAILADARRVDDDFAVSLTLQTLTVVAAADGHVAEAVRLADESVAVANRSAQPRVGQLHPHLYRGAILIQADRLADAEATLQEGRRRAEERGAVVWLPLYQWGLALRRVLTLEWDDALAEIEVGLTIAEDVGTRLHVPLLHGMAAYIAMQRGDLAGAEASLDEAVREFLAGTSEAWQTEAAKGVGTAAGRWPIEWGLWISSLLQEAVGDAAAAARLMADAWAASAPLRYLLGYRFFGPDLVRLALAAQEIDVALSVTLEVEEGARRSGLRGTAGAAALRCRGLIDGDADRLLEAVALLRGLPSVAELASALEEAGGALAREGRREEAQAALEEALALYDGAGARRATARIEAALRAHGVRRRKAAMAGGRPSTGWESLTATELTVARLAAEGLTNRQVGERLYVSRRTVETHLAHVFAKLSVSGRAQLAAEVARHP